MLAGRNPILGSPTSAIPTTAANKTICLAMIVKNERDVIARALQSVRPIIDTWVVCDTGSQDGTQDIVRDILADIPGELAEVPWRNFGHNRSEAMQKARKRADYTLIIDADMIACVHNDFKAGLSADSYLLQYEGELDYWQPMLFSNQHDWSFVGHTHEYAFSETAISIEKLKGLTLNHLADGGNRAEKIERDIGLLTKALDDDPADTRAMFYLAQTYFDAGNFAPARQWYENRIEAGGWAEEVWFSKFRLAVLNELQGLPWAETQNAYLEAFNFRPSRLEALYPIVKNYRLAGDYTIASLLANAVLQTGYPDDLLFIDKPIYSYRLKLELAICSYYLGNHELAISLYNQVLDVEALPADHFQLCLRNRAYSLEAIYQPNFAAAQIANHITVIVPFFNAGDYLDNCIASLLSQDYTNFDVLFIDDASTDGCAHSIPLEDKRFRLLQQDRRVGGAKNLHTALCSIEDPKTIAVFLDGDDWFACDDALSHINCCYNELDCWVLYGQFQRVDGVYGISKPYASEAQFRRCRDVWYSSAPRSFRAGLYQEALRQDPDCSFMKSKDGSWFTSAMDMALMYPILEIAGFDKVRFNDRVIYIYNTDNPINVHKERRAEELSSNLEIIAKKRFRQLDHWE